MTETELYERDGLFHNIVKKSVIMDGRYHVLPNGTSDLNTNTISGIELPVDNYPLVACLSPSSITDPSFKSAEWEKFSFRLLFLCTTHSTGDNQYKDRDHLTNTSRHSIPRDWSDMKAVAFSFMNALEQVTIRSLRGKFNLDDRTPVKIIRVTQIQTSMVSGVMLMFGGMLSTNCNHTDISSVAISEIVVPVSVHDQHKH